jgi:hypothetical protein
MKFPQFPSRRKLFPWLLASAPVGAALGQASADNSKTSAGTPASAITYDGGTLQDIADTAKPIVHYAALRSYSGRATTVRITSPGIAGSFYASADTAAADNGGTVIVDKAGRRWKRTFTGPINVMWFGASGGQIKPSDPAAEPDDTAAIKAAIAATGSGGHLFFPAGTYKTKAPILAENLRGLILSGASGQYGFSGSRIIGAHSGKATLSLIGSLFCSIENLSIEGDSATPPRTGLLLGRSSRSSAGNHTFKNVHVQGHYGVAGVYNIASEENTWLNCYINPAAAAVSGVYMGQGDAHSIGGMTGSSMEENTFIGGTIGNGDSTPGSTCVFIDCGASTGHHHFIGTFLSKNGGDSFITIQLGKADRQDSTFPISFYDVAGEMGATPPLYGLHFTSARPISLAGFTAHNIRFQTPSKSNIYCDGGGTVYLIGAEISTPYRPTGRLPSVFHRCDGCTLTLLSESNISFLELRGSIVRYNSNVAPPSVSGVNAGTLMLNMAGTFYTINGSAVGTAAMQINSSATVGGGTAIFAASNKPGGNTSVKKWLPVSVDGGTYYIPLWN